MQSEEDAKAQEKADKEKKEQSMRLELQRKVEEAGKRQKKAAHADALSNYKTLLNETVKDIDARWSEWKTRLLRDPQACLQLLQSQSHSTSWGRVNILLDSMLRHQSFMYHKCFCVFNNVDLKYACK